MKSLSILFFASLFLFAGCASTNLESIKNEEVNFYDYKKVLVHCNTADISLRKKLETYTKNEFKKYGKPSECSIELFPPLKEYSESEINSTIEKNNFDSVLIFSPISESSKYSGSTIIPFVGNFAMTFPEYEQIYIYDIEFKDLKKNVLILKSTSKTSETDISSASKSIAKKIVSEIMKNEYSDLYKTLQETIKQEFEHAIFIGNDKNSKFIYKKEIAKFSVKDNGILITLQSVPNSEKSLFTAKDTQYGNTQYGKIYSYTLNSSEQIKNVVDELKTIAK